MKNSSQIFLELIGFIYIKTTVSISRLTSFSRFGKRCFVARDICKNVKGKKLKEQEISLAKKHRFPNRKKLVNREIETVVLMYINPINSKKSVTSFSWIFHFWFIDFSEKIFDMFFTPTECPGGMWNYVKHWK